MSDSRRVLGAKMLLADVYHLPALARLGVIVTLLGLSIGASIYAHRRDLARARRPVGRRGAGTEPLIKTAKSLRHFRC